MKRGLPRRLAPFVLLALGLAFLLLGIWRGEVAELFRKSVNICLECVGIG